MCFVDSSQQFCCAKPQTDLFVLNIQRKEMLAPQAAIIIMAKRGRPRKYPVENVESIEKDMPDTEVKVDISGPAVKKSTSAEKKKTSGAKQSKNAKPAAPKSKPKLRPQEESEIFALDIGTRNVVGIIGSMSDGNFCVDHAVSVPHKHRAMIDGQIEDIPEVARIAGIVKEKLEEISGVKLSRVAIAAAGRALKTRRTQLTFDVEDKDTISEDDVKSFELECALKAQDELDAETVNIITTSITRRILAIISSKSSFKSISKVSSICSFMIYFSN